MQLSLAISFILLASTVTPAVAEEEACESSTPETGRSLLQVRKGEEGAVDGPGSESDSSLLQAGKTCSYQLTGDQDGSQVCAHLETLDSFTSGAFATLDEEGYQQTAALCCHHEMSLFVRREIARQGFDVCDLSDLHGFVHWYDCSSDTFRTDVRRSGDDKKTFAEMQKEIAGVMTSPCPWLGHLPNCPVKGENCRMFPACKPEAYPVDSQPGATAPLTAAGYLAVAKRCCHLEAEQFVRRLIAAMGFAICDQSALQGFLHWFDCSSVHPVHDPVYGAYDYTHYNDNQSFEGLKEGLIMARSGLPPMCPWLGGIGEACPPTGHNCPVVEVPEPEAHRRRTACR